MRSALFKHSNESDRDPGQWTNLPGLCCQAAGGEFDRAEEFTQAWVLFYAGAGILDKIEDRDPPDAWWAEVGEGAAINAASGLYFTASLLLNHLHRRKETCELAGEIIEDFYQTLLKMSSGQHRDLITPEPTLEEYWEIVTVKSGEFFSLACRCGARLATRESSRVQCYSNFGLHLGILLQILDDLEDLKDLNKGFIESKSNDIRRSLPLIYLFQVSSHQKRIEIQELLRLVPEDMDAGKRLFECIDQAGAAFYLLTEFEKQRLRALEALDKAIPDPKAGSRLVEMLPKIETIRNQE
jgi:geranylgeranyl pyrophosphate synthase